MLRLLNLLLLVVVFTLGAAFAYINPGDVTVSYYLGQVSLPLGVVFFLLFGAGLVLGIVVGAAGTLRLRSENARLRRSARLAHEEVNNLRALPLRDR